MQGIQSSTVPEKMEKRGLMSVTTGPLEAAKRYLDRQRESEAALAAMDAEEAGASLDDGRPAWLKRWRVDAPQETPGTTPAAETVQTLPADTLRDDQALSVNGYTGQSIEAAFAFETVFQFETELEAEGTEDWLDLSGERPQLEDPAQAQDLVDPARDLELEERGNTFETSSREEASHSTTASAATGQLLDPQAVRAAIFRLAQESSKRWTPPQELPGTPGKDGAGNGLPPDALTQAVAPGETITGDSGADFAEVARQLWAMPEAVDSTDQTPSFQTPSAKKNAIADVELTGPARGSWTGEDASVAQETAREASVSAAQETCPGEDGRPEQPGDGKLDQEWTLNRALGEIRSEIRDDMRFEAAEVGNATVASLPEGLPATSSPRETCDTASDAPALAHDASNLLSALKLYSELLALSGVLHARHSHYAQDLKLLAARSEVLIDRLLASCSLAERDAQQLVQGHVLAGTGRASLDSGNLPVGERRSGQTAEAMPNGSNLPSRFTESDSNQRNRVAPVEDLATKDIGVVAARSLESSFSRKLEEKPSGQVEAIQESATEGGAVGIENPIDNPENDRLAVAVTQFPGKDSTAHLKKTEMSQAGAKEMGANRGSEGDPINLVDLLTRWGSLLSMIARGPVEVKFGPQAALPIRIGEEAMERILVNLVHNAMTATRNGGAIRIGVGRAETRRPALSHPASEERARPASKMVLTVDDSGCGMSEQQIAKVLGMGRSMADATGTGAKVGIDGSIQDSSGSGIDPNAEPKTDQVAVHRIDAQPRALTGSARSNRRHGMGLQIVRELVSASGGELAIYSRCGVGTRIEIQWPTLPASVEHEPGSGHIPPASAGVMAATSRSGLAGQRRTQQGLEGAIAC